MMVFNLGTSNSSISRSIERRLRRHNTALLRIYSFGLFWCTQASEPESSESAASSNRKGQMRDAVEDTHEERQEQFALAKQSTNFSPQKNEVNEAYEYISTPSRPLLDKPENALVAPTDVSVFENPNNRQNSGQFVKSDEILLTRDLKLNGNITPSVSSPSKSKSNNYGDSKSGKRGIEQNDHNTAGNEQRSPELVDRQETRSKNKPKLDYDPEEFWHRMADFINRIATLLLIPAQLLIVIFFLVPIFV